jgi:hypothetical protein
MNRRIVSLQERFQKIRTPQEARVLLHQTLELLITVDKPILEKFILNLRQNATDLKFSYYRARCQYILIPPEDALTFWINYILGNCPEKSRYAYFEGEILELLKILEIAQLNENRRCLPHKNVSAALKIVKAKYPGFLTGLTKDPLLIPLMNFSLQGEAGLEWPQHHCLTLFTPPNNEEYSLVTILHSLVHFIHYHLTEDLAVLPPGFENLQKDLLEESNVFQTLNAESFVETITASLLYETDYMSLVAYMEFNQQQQEAIRQYLLWLQNMFFTGLGENVKKLMEEHQRKLQA